jgi:thermitase
MRELGSLLLLFLAMAEAAAAPPPWAEGRILMAPRAGGADHALERILKNAYGRAIERLQGRNVRVVEVLGVLKKRAVEQRARDPQVALAELDRAVEPTELVANDPRFQDAWHLKTMLRPMANSGQR